MSLSNCLRHRVHRAVLVLFFIQRYNFDTNTWLDALYSRARWVQLYASGHDYHPDWGFITTGGNEYHPTGNGIMRKVLAILALAIDKLSLY